MDYGVGTCVILFTVNWGIHRGIVFCLNMYAHAIKQELKAVQI